MDKRGQHNAETVVVVPVVRIVPVAVGAALFEPAPTEAACCRELSFCHLLPAAQQAANFIDHFSRVFVLPTRQPAPTVAEAQIITQLAQRFIRPQQALLRVRSAAAIRLFQALAQIKSGIEQALGERKAVRARKAVGRRQQPAAAGQRCA